jgi:transcriptional regulator with XRE-family HTH domain
MEPSQDYAVTIKVRNGRILSRMRAKGIKSLPELAEKAGIGYSRLAAIVALKALPTGKRGAWVAGIENVAGVLGCDVEDLFTEAQRENVVERNSAEIYMDEPDVMALASGDWERTQRIKMEANRLLGAIRRPRDREVIERRMAGETLEEIGEDLGVLRERVRQIEARAQRDMRWAARELSEGREVLRD